MAPTQPPSKGRNDSIRHFRSNHSVSRPCGPASTQRRGGASCRKRARGVWGSQERSGAAPLPTQLFPRPSPLAQSPRGFPADPKEVDHWLAPPSFLPQPCPPPGGRPPSPGVSAPKPWPVLPCQTSPAPCSWWGPVHLRGQLVLGHGCTPAVLEVGLTVGGAECARAPLSPLLAPLLPLRLLPTQQEEQAMPGWTFQGPPQLLWGGQAGHAPWDGRLTVLTHCRPLRHWGHAASSPEPTVTQFPPPYSLVQSVGGSSCGHTQ